MATPTLTAETDTGSPARSGRVARRGGSRRGWRRWRDWPEQAWWPWATRGVAASFFAVVAWLIFRQARTVDWPAVLQALRDSGAVLALGLAWTIRSLAFLAPLLLLIGAVLWWRRRRRR